MTMIDDVLRQNWSTLHSLSKDLHLLHSAKAARRTQASERRGKLETLDGAAAVSEPDRHCTLAVESSVFERCF
jgi:hypothetical protein